ncbi:MAG TPA: flagellar hook-basal body complex protein, partial [bacterium]|nr:flagellar hook-basal body complex protein [bacterium]
MDNQLRDPRRQISDDVTVLLARFLDALVLVRGIQSVVVDERGVVTGMYSNGRMDFYQIALVDFASYAGLAKMGKNLYTETMASGEAMPGTVGSGRLGTISPNALEMSNVDLAQEFVKMITTQ